MGRPAGRSKGSRNKEPHVPFIVGVPPLRGEVILTRAEHDRLRRWVNEADRLSAKAARGDQAAAEAYRAFLADS